jgi:hypothetical protein
MNSHRMVACITLLAFLFASCRSSPPFQTSTLEPTASTYQPTFAPVPATESAFSQADPTAISSIDQADSTCVTARSAYQEQPLFQVCYSTGAWRMLEDTTLEHRQLPGCTLWLTAIGGEAMGPVIKNEIQIGRHTATVRYFPQVQLITYQLDIRESVFLFQANLSPDAQGGGVDRCREAVERVVETFRLVLDE